ncbi:hypothetical protein G8759_17610 [Spirosoma aureum]|uniref:PKD/Chitinase domain-containing protein n=1 Tax=Spirosoma aureum TaxID=2692134 RepID=A0A6G9AQ11_9BACT|nr:hypothetical protein [Spirosoma aureum]QIP14303.1 hypothetical protein G8759_17610 [Spirosoma aureum]
MSYFCLLFLLALSSYSLPITKKPPGRRLVSVTPRPTPVNLFTYHNFANLSDRQSLSPTDNDPIRFSLSINKQSIRLGETIDLTIKAELLTISPNLLFHLPGSNTYRLKLILPAGFEQTGGDFVDYIGAELSYPARTEATYHIIGHFSTITPGTSFRLLRSHGQADAQSLFVEKALVNLKELTTQKAALREPANDANNQTNSASPTLYVVTDNLVTDNTAKGARVASPDYRGFLEFANCDVIGGWAIDVNSPKQSVDLDIYIDNTKVATIKADQNRSDVAKTYNVSGFELYGYRWSLPEKYKANKSLKVSVRFANSNTDLIQSPTNTPVCPGTSPGTDPSDPSGTPNYRGFLEFANCDVIGGWAINLNSPKQSVNLDIYINDVKVTTIKADQNRTDVSKSFNVSGFELYGYRWNLPDQYKNNSPLKIAAKVAGSSFELTQSPLSTPSCPGSSTPTCAFDVSVNSVNASCGGSVSLNANCSGPNCDQVSYSWTGNGISQQGQTLNLTAPSANGTYTYTVTATRPGCASKTATGTVTVSGCNTQPSCAFDVSVNSVNASCGSAVSLNANCSGPNCDQVSYSWTGNGISQQGQTLNLTAPSTNGTYSYTVTATRNGCTSKTAVGTVTVAGCTPTQNCAFDVSVNSVSATCGSAVSLNANCSGPNCDQVSYSWTGNGITQQGQTLNLTAPSTNGTYSYTVTATRNGCSSKTAVGTVTVSGCNAPAPDYRSYLDNANCNALNGWILDTKATQKSQSVDVYINGTKATTLLADQTRTDVALAYNTNGFAQFGYSWSIPDSYKTNAPLTIAVKVAGSTFELAHSPITTASCPSSTSTANCAFDVSVNSVNASCGSAVSLNANCSGPNCDQVSYSWTGNGVSQQGQTLNFTAPSANGTYSYTVTATRNGCSSKTATGTVTVDGCTPTQNCAFDVSVNSMSATCGGTVSLNANCSGPNCDQVSYSWTGNGINQQGQTLNLTAPSANGTYSYTVTATRNGCTSKTATGTVTVAGCTPTQNCAFDVSVNSVSATCGNAVSLNASCSGPNCDQVSYSWTGNGVTQQGQTLSLTAPSTNGTYSYTVTATRNGCTSKTATGTVTVAGCTPTQNCAFDVSVNSVSATCGNAVSLNANCSGPNCDQVSYSWTGNGISQQGQTLSLTAPSTNGTYSYTVTATRNGCSSKTAVGTVTISGCNAPAPDYRSYLDNANCNALNGWILDTKATQKSQSVDVYINGTKATTLLADQTRTDVALAYNTNGFAQFGYSWSIPDSYKTNTPLTIAVKVAGSTFELAHSPITTASCPSSTSTANCAFDVAVNSVNASCGSAVSLNANCSGPNCDQVSYSWTGNGVTQQGQTLSLTAPSTNGTYSYTVTATRNGCTSKTAVGVVTVSGCSTQPSCAFDVSVNSVNTGCGGAVSLNANCSGPNCDQITYSWTGNGINQQGQTINFTAPSTNGSYTYTVTATRNGCTSKTATGTVTVDGCTPPSNEDYPILNSPQPDDKRPILQNERVRVAIDLGVGGVVREVTDLQVGENMINCYVKSNGKRDPGRDDQISLYSLPDANTGWTQNGKRVLDDIGYNPVQGGSIAGDYSPILGYGRTDKMLYCKTRGLHWGLSNEPGDYIVEQWIRLEGNIVRRHVRITGSRPDQTKYADSRQQELPCTYTSSMYYQFYVVQGDPYTNAPLVNVNAIPNIGGSGKSFNQYNYQGHMGPYDISASEPWIVAVRPNTNRGLALHTPYSHEFKAGLFDSPGIGPPESINAGYIANTVNMILDPNGVYEFDINVVVGTLDEIRNTINTLPRSETKPNYVFANSPTRKGFTYRKGYDQGFPVGDELVITPTDRRFRLSSPQKGYKTAEFGTIYVRMRAITPETQLSLDWKKVGQSELEAEQSNQAIRFNIIPDNRYHTYAIPVKNSAQWNGIVNSFTIRYINPTESGIQGQQFGVKWISATDLGDQ